MNGSPAPAPAREAFAAAITQAPPGTLLAVLHLGAQRSSLAVGNDAAAPALHEFALGLQSLAADHLRHVPPTPLELEEAIATVEDAVMPLHRLLPPGATLVAALPSLIPLLDAGAGATPTLQHDITAVERAFDRLAAVSLGRPLSHDPAMADPAVAAALLVLREVMHHLGFDEVRLLAEPQTDR